MNNAVRNRVLVWGLSNNRAGTEAVINNYVTHIPNVAFDFLCYEEPRNYHHLFEGTNNSYYVIPVKIKHPIKNWFALRSFMKEHGGEYRALWANLNDISNIDVLVQAKKCGIPRRIVHIHNAGLPKVFVTKLFSKLNFKKCLSLATDRWACSRAAGDFLFGNLPYRVIPNAVDAKGRSFDSNKRSKIRDDWELRDRFVIGTVGRLADQKNQRMLIELMPKIISQRSDAALMLVGDGALRLELQSLASKLGVSDRVIFTGPQEDMQAYYSAFDVFAFPSFYEGLSLSLLEAQFNGLPCVVSDGVSHETFITSNILIAPLDNRSLWISAICNAKREANSLITERAQKFTFEHVEQIAPALF